MANDKKPSIYSDRGTIGSADDLDEYGVWVKSEPQDIAAGSAAHSDDFSDDFSFEDSSIGAGEDALALGNLGSDFDSGSDDFEVPTVKSIEKNIENVQDEFETSVLNQKGGDLSTQLLLKIANELSSIRGELCELKKEFSVVRTDGRDVRPDAEQEQEGEGEGDRSGFFSEEDDETIALTGDELNNILNTADFTEESGANETPETEFTPGEEQEEEKTPDADASPAVEDLSQEDASLPDLDFNEAGTETEPQDAASEEIVDFNTDDLDIDIDQEDISDEPPPETPEGSFGEEESLDIDSYDKEAASSETDVPQDELSDDALTDDLSFADDLSAEDLSIDDFAADDFSTENLTTDEIPGEAAEHDSEELAKLREEGALPITPAPENSSYLETEEEHLDLSDAVIDEPVLSTEGISDEIAEPSFDLSEEDLDMDSLGDFDTSDAADTSDTTDTGDAADTSDATDTSDAETEEIEIEDDILAHDIDIDISLDDEPAKDAPKKEKPAAEQPDSSIDNDLAAEIPDDDLNIEASDDDFNIGASDDLDINIDIPSDNDDFTLSEEEEADANNPDLAEDALDASSDTVSETSETDAVEQSDSLDDDLSIEMSDDDLDFDISADDSIPDDNFDVGEQAKDDLAVEQTDDTAESDLDDSVDQVIPEGFEAEIEETPVPFDDDLGDLTVDGLGDVLEDTPPEPPAIAAEPPAAAEPVQRAAAKSAPAAAKGKEPFQIPSELKSELRNILTYMDQLLESLPEEKIEEFAKSDYFDSYKKLFKELGLV